MSRFNECPKCSSRDIEMLETYWMCYDCPWEEELNQEEKDSLEEKDGKD